MVIDQVGKNLRKALSFGGIALLFGTVLVKDYYTTGLMIISRGT